MAKHSCTALEGQGSFNGPAQTLHPLSKRKYFAVTVNAKEISTPNPLVALFKRQFSFDPYKNIKVQAASNPADMNIFLATEKWLDEVKGLTKTQNFAIGSNPLPKYWKKIQNVVDSWISALNLRLGKSSHSVQLKMSDYNK